MVPVRVLWMGVVVRPTLGVGTRYVGVVMRRWVIAAIGGLALMLSAAAAGVALTNDDDGGRHPMQRMMSGSRWEGSGWEQWPGGMGRWMPGAPVDSEFEYLTEMVAHHAEAVVAAQQLARSDRPQLRRFGAEIVATQSAQIDQMREWLARWYPGRSTDVDYRPMMRDLSGLPGDRLDWTFLEDMIRHHMAAVMMSQRLLVRGLAEHQDVAELARSIRDVQHAEIFQMQRWLADWFGVHWGGMGTRMMW